MTRQFLNRTDAGRQLAERLLPFAGRKDVLLLGLPPGGVVVAAELSRTLGLPLEGFAVCPLKVEGRPRGIGAVATGGVRVIDQALVTQLALPRRLVDEESEVAERELSRQEHRYQLERGVPSLLGRTVIVVDEGAETGTSLISAIRALRLFGPASIIAAAPMMSAVAACHVAANADRTVTVSIPPAGTTIPSCYDDFAPVPDDVVCRLLMTCREQVAQEA